MLESPGYWGAYQPVLEWLAAEELKQVPIANSLLSGRELVPPDYLNATPISLSPLYEDAWKVKGEKFDAAGVWPHDAQANRGEVRAPKMILDVSQTSAMRAILTTSVSLVQGPPGTGKSFLGAKAAQVFHKALFERGYMEPILVVCLTNHALDQFLEDMLPVMPQLLRFGGCSKSDNPKLKERVISRIPLGSERRNRLQELKNALVKSGTKLQDLWAALQLQAEAILPLIARCMNPRTAEMFLGRSDRKEDAAGDAYLLTLLTAVGKWLDLDSELTHAEKAVSTAEKLDEDFIEKMKHKFADIASDELRRDIWRMKRGDKWYTIELMQKALYSAIETEIRTGLIALETKSTEFQTAKMSADLSLCYAQTPLVGMTANYAARHRALLHKLQPRVCIVEEAGELLESQLLACLSSPALEHLVLIGDHQQLRPKVSDFKLERDFHLDISLFERLLSNGTRSSSLSLQLRMRPEICDLVRPFYSHLQDHDRVFQHPPCRGVHRNVFFLTHGVYEDEVFRTSSKQNSHEARFLAKLAEYFVLVKGYQPSEVTLLTPYLGQKRLFKEILAQSDESRADGRTLAPPLMPDRGQRTHEDDDHKQKEHPDHVVVATIDDYQGEENKIILLSLVRSNPTGKLGFVGIENRIIVALSRAQHGMIMMGNGDQMAEGSPLWARALEHMKQRHGYGQHLHLTHRRFPDKGLLVNRPEDMDKVLHGDYESLQSVKQRVHVSKQSHATPGGGRKRSRPASGTSK
eukprot:TRINITY_DN14531_c0_g1_i1.p1 TRINITY_DN14531_c0_g1~~TRINITY_DN14531_c0_g1_i1.p1  ORF type:complete len:748 (+),score=185.98 TRINITY_DN14531_c0_g1_i1:122-2365(+)